MSSLRMSKYLKMLALCVRTLIMGLPLCRKGHRVFKGKVGYEKSLKSEGLHWWQD